MEDEVINAWSAVLTAHRWCLYACTLVSCIIMVTTINFLAFSHQNQISDRRQSLIDVISTSEKCSPCLYHSHGCTRNQNTLFSCIIMVTSIIFSFFLETQMVGLPLKWRVHADMTSFWRWSIHSTIPTSWLYSDFLYNHGDQSTLYC